MTIDVENIHSLVHLLHISTLHGVKLRKKPWKCSQRRLKGDNPVGGLLFYKSKVLVSCTRKCHDPVGHTGIQMLSPIPIAPQNIQKMRDWAQTFGVAVRQMVKAETLPSYPDQREIQLGEPLSFELADFKEQRKKKKKKNQPKRKMRYWILEYDSPVNDEESHESFPDDETACDDRVTLSLERETHFLRGRFFLFRKKYSL